MPQKLSYVNLPYNHVSQTIGYGMIPSLPLGYKHRTDSTTYQKMCRNFPSERERSSSSFNSSESRSVLFTSLSGDRDFLAFGRVAYVSPTPRSLLSDVSSSRFLTIFSNAIGD